MIAPCAAAVAAGSGGAGTDGEDLPITSLLSLRKNAYGLPKMCLMALVTFIMPKCASRYKQEML